jgi:predicted nucleic acid-binding protein
MNIVVDTSVIVAVIAREPERDSLIDLTMGADVIAPHSVHWEVGNAFSAMLKRERATPQQVRKALEAYGKMAIRFVDIELDQSLDIAEELNIYAYDAYVIRCALRYRSPLISLDHHLILCARKMNVKVMEVT